MQNLHLVVLVLGVSCSYVPDGKLSLVYSLSLQVYCNSLNSLPCAKRRSL